MDIVLGVSAAPATVRMVLVEGENADGVTVDQDEFEVVVAPNTPDGTAAVAEPTTVADRVVAAILGTRESAAEGGYHLASTGVTFSDQVEAGILHDALAHHKIENVMLVSAFMAAAALAQAVGGATGYSRTALMFIEPDTATLAVVDSADGSIVDVHRRALSDADDTAVAELTQMVADVDGLETRPDGVFVIGGSGVEIAAIKSQLDAATRLPVSVPEEPKMALAYGAALASAHAPLFASSTQAMAYAQDAGTGAVDPNALLGYRWVQVGPVDHDTTVDYEPLAYSAVPEGDEVSRAIPIPAGAERLDSAFLDFHTDVSRQRRRPLLVVGSVAALFVAGVAALVVSLAVDMRPSAADRPSPGGHVVVPTRHPPAPAPPPQTVQQPAPAVAPQAPAPAPAAPAPPAPVDLPAPAPPPAAPPAPPPPPPALPPINIQIPGLLPGLGGGPPVLGPPVRGGRDDDDHGGGRGRGGGPPIPFFGGGHGHGGGLPIPNIPGIPGL